MGKELIETTLGELIVALTEEARCETAQRHEVYKIVSDILAELFRSKSCVFRARDNEISEATNTGASSLRWQ